MYIINEFIYVEVNKTSPALSGDDAVRGSAARNVNVTDFKTYRCIIVKRLSDLYQCDFSSTEKKGLWLNHFWLSYSYDILQVLNYLTTELTLTLL